MAKKYIDEEGDEIIIYSKSELTDKVLQLQREVNRLQEQLNKIPKANNYIATCWVDGEIVTLKLGKRDYPSYNNLKVIVMTFKQINEPKDFIVLGIMAMTDEEFKQYHS